MPLPPDDPWASYARTAVEIVRPGEPKLVVRAAPVGDHGSWPWSSPAPLHIVTAWDPGNERLGDEENRRRQAALAAELQRLGPPASWFAVGVDPLSGHREEGVAVQGLAERMILRVGARYGQNAIFSWTPNEWAIVACTGGRRVALGWSTDQGAGTDPTAGV